MIYITSHHDVERVLTLQYHIQEKQCQRLTGLNAMFVTQIKSGICSVRVIVWYIYLFGTVKNVKTSKLKV